ncbi:MAG: response regulator [Chitinophagales bacterium]|jgi:DNA-binding NtrC family response regulator|nr:response regulator [Sphingobacteriales bacterium]MBP7533090.1 response regulator [Chitinophagales bacterium]
MAERNFRIYLVDDDVKTLIMLKHNLEKKIEHPITVNVFAYGENCLDRMEEEKPDIVVLDYYLNAIREDAQKGSDVLRQIKLLSPDTQVVMISGQEDMETALECIRAGAYDYIIKNEKAMSRLELVVNKLLYDMEKNRV